jgi:choloylglycine hydrolase
MCTGIRLTADDGSIVHARTLEFAVDIHSDVISIPRGHLRTSTTPDGRAGKSWTAKYASLGASAEGLPVLVDGLNERGLAVGAFYFPSTVGYQAYSPDSAADTVAPWELGSYLLENHATVEEVRASIGQVIVPEVTFPSWGFAPPLHFVVHDAGGSSVVLEHVGGLLRVHENPLGVMSNSPSFDWHMTNLRNYVNFSFSNVADVDLGGVVLAPFGQGTGMLGLPGDFTPPSRFVRAAAFSSSALPTATGYEAVLQSFKLLNAFDIPKGAVREREQDEQGNELADHTLWTSASDLSAKTFYFRTYDSSQIRKVCLTHELLDTTAICRWPMAGTEVVRDLVVEPMG